MPAGCTFAGHNWDYLTFELGLPHLICDAHHLPGHSSIYVADPGEEVGLCRIQHECLVEAETDRVYRALDRTARAAVPA